MSLLRCRPERLWRADGIARVKKLGIESAERGQSIDVGRYRKDPKIAAEHVDTARDQAQFRLTTEAESREE